MAINIFKKTILLQIFFILCTFTLLIIEETYFPYEEIDLDMTLTAEDMLILGMAVLFLLFLPFMYYFVE